jgi:hypothetical protein
VIRAILLQVSIDVTTTPTRTPQHSSARGVAFWAIFAVLAAILLVSLWRLRRRSAEPEN